MKKVTFFMLIIMSLSLLASCNVKSSDETKVETLDENKIEEEVKTETAENSNWIELGGEIYVDNGNINIKGESNLVEGTKVKIDWLQKPFTFRHIICFSCESTSIVDQDGNFSFEVPQTLDIYNYVLITLEVIPGTGQSDEINALYGKKGEHLEGPFVSKYEMLGEERQKIYAEVLIQPMGMQKVYSIETPKLGKVPEDYGSTNVWVDASFTNDHQFFYVEGKSNLLEGTKFEALYYSSEDATISQHWFSSIGYVRVNNVSSGASTIGGFGYRTISICFSPLSFIFTDSPV